MPKMTLRDPRGAIRSAVLAIVLLVAALAAAAVFGSCSNPLAAAAQTARTQAVAPVLALSVSGKSVVSGDTLNVDSVFVSNTAETTIIIKNSGTNELDINTSGITLTLGSGTETGTFSLNNSPSATLASGAMTTLVLRFVPASVGAKSAAISIPSNDAKTPVFSFTVTGTGFTMALSTSGMSSITCSTASSGGGITSDGGSPITSRGICWSRLPNPTIADSSQVDGGSGTGSFTCALAGLLPGTYYYVRAWATNATGTGYAPSVGFTTVAATAPTTAAPSAINATTATAGGTAIADAGVAITARGVCWNTTGNPTIADAKSVDGSGAGSFASSMTGLSCATTYHVRAYSTNAANTVYGPEVTLKTVGYIGPSGGYVFYDQGSVINGWRYLEAAPGDIGTYSWGPDGSVSTGTGIGTGSQNTYNLCAAGGYSYPAAAYSFNATYGGNTGFFLPSKDELDLMFRNLAANGLGGPWNSFWYWSSSQEGTYQAYLEKPDLTSGNYLKSYSYSVRSARAY